ncbi:hypothetical protein C8R46DRAFT_1123871 [Mycena filopes]|nr:hypothetical protein C8R46DRAFT_1123871 [Mycena filopes]
MESCAAGCGKAGPLKCSGCKVVRYCDGQCQKLDWKAHKLDCESLGTTGKPRTTHCSGCKKPFGGFIGEVDAICPDCGYAACNDCSCDNRLGTCYCANSNFGRRYCEQVPEWYHSAARTGTPYGGDNHPDETLSEVHSIPAAEWEHEARVCGNCGETKVCLRPEYICREFLCQ